MATKIRSALKMNRKSVLAITAILATLALLLCSIFIGKSDAEEGIDIPNISADTNEQGEKYLDIVSANLEYGDYLHIFYAVEPNLEGMEYSEVKMLFWNTPMTEYVYGTHVSETKPVVEGISITAGAEKYEGCTVFSSLGIAAKEIADVTYARACVSDAEGNIYYSNVVRYSVLDYVYSRYRENESLGNVSANQLALYGRILEYGASAQVVFDYKASRLATSRAVTVEVKDGKTTDGFSFGTYLETDSFTLIADRESEQRPFLYWTDPLGEIISRERLFEVTVDETTPSGTYTAVYSELTSVSVVGGRVNGADSAVFLDGEGYTVTADIPEGCYFVGWTKNGEPINEGESFTDIAYGGGEIIYVARFERLGGLSFDKLPDGPLTGGIPVSSEGYGFVFKGTEPDFSAEIVTLESGNKVLKFTDGNEEYGEGISIDAIGEGDFTVFEADILIEDFTDGSTPLQLHFGDYVVQFAALESAALKIQDSCDKKVGYLDTYVRPDEWRNIKVAVTNKARGEEAPRAYLFVDGECVTKSYNVFEGAVTDSFQLYALKASKLTAYFDNVELYRTDLTDEQERGFAPKNIIVTPSSTSKDRFQNAEILLDADALDALKKMDAELFSENIYLWIAELYDPETSALYFSISGRNSYGYLPDIETVAQGYGLLSTLGLGGNTVILNAEQKANLTSWIQTLQSNRDGYYYHPHWGVSIGNSRLSRDLGNSSSSYSASGKLAYRLFNDANYRLSGGSSGSKGVTVPTTYDNSLTCQLRRSAVKAVSKVVLASASDNSSMPVHLRSEENLITYINNSWNSSCKVAGVHERHFCTDECVIVENPDDSYMRFENGELVITRGYECTSCHVCNHELGHSYGFGHGVTSMGSQIKAAGLGRPTVMYFYDIQENVQSSLRRKAENKYVSENGSSAWEALSDEERTAVRRSAENGIWEEEVTYNTISGLLKISGIPSTHGFEFLYAEAAINSALECALFSVENFVDSKQPIVSIYNPFNAINGIMNNINNYGSDKEVRSRARTLVRERAAELIENTQGKLACFLMPDGGYSYNMKGFCTHSQGQPVAIAGSKEGDVNGTALVLGTRGALLSCLGVSVTAPFDGSNAFIEGGMDLNGNGTLTDEYDLDGDGVAEVKESSLTHADRFRYIITTKDEVAKKDTTAEKYIYTFDEGTLVPSGGDVIDDNGNAVLKAVDDSTSGGRSVSFGSPNVIDDECKIRMTFDMKVVECNNSTSHQIFVDSGILRIDMIYNNGDFTFDNVTGNRNNLVDENGDKIKVLANLWFTIDLQIYPEGLLLDGKTVYGTFSVTQKGVTRTATLSELAGYSANATDFRIYSLISSKNTVYYDNVSVYNGIRPGVYDGEYHFDTVAQKIADESVLVKSPTNEKDTVYKLEGGEALFDPHQYSGSGVLYNFNSLQASLLLKDSRVGERVDFSFVDEGGKIISGIYLIVGEGGELAFFAPNGQILKEYIPRDEVLADGSVERITRERDMIITADLQKWIVVKLEYHYDMESPQFDVTVRYADMGKNGYNTTTASTLSGVDVLEVGANPYKFTKLSVNSDGRVYLDDLYVRNVFVGCDGEHEFIEKESGAYSLGTDEYGHRIYYYSCRKCGVPSQQIFTLHKFGRVVADEFKISDATIESAARYFESCELCAQTGDKTFTYGLPLLDPTKWNFTDSSGEENRIPDYLGITTATNKTATVMSEVVGDAVNYFLRLEKRRAQGSHSATFMYKRSAGEEISDKYIYEFDFRWIEASDMHSSRGVILVKAGAGGAVVSLGGYTASADGMQVDHGGVTMNSGDWHSLKYLFSRNEAGDGWDGSAFIDGNKAYSFTVLGNAVPYVIYETRWNLTEAGVTRYSDMTVDFDRLKAYTAEGVGHEPVEIADKRYLKSEATCISPEVYYRSCKWCGEILDGETFTLGVTTGHNFANVLDPEHLVCDMSCTEAATYYRSCKICGERSADTFTVGEPLGHDEVKHVVSEATRDEAQKAYFTCNRCDYVSETVSVGAPLCHTFDNQKLPNTVSVVGFQSEPLTEGLWATVLSEEVEGAVNYYLNVQKYSNTATHSLTFRSGEAERDKYVYEFDFRWNYADRMRGNVPILVKLYRTGSSSYKSFAFTASSTGGSANHTGVSFKSGEWHTVRYEITKSDEGNWVFELIIDGDRIATETVSGSSGIPYVVYETRYGQTERIDTDGDGIDDTTVILNCTDISFDIDNVYCEAE